MLSECRNCSLRRAFRHSAAANVGSGRLMMAKRKPRSREESEPAPPKPAPGIRHTDFAILPPIEPMLAKLADELPADGAFLFEPKWDGFRAIVFRGASEVFIQSRDSRPFDRYFPDLHEALLDKLPAGCV